MSGFGLPEGASDASDARLLTETEKYEQSVLSLSSAPRRQWHVRLPDGSLVHTVRVSSPEAAETRWAAPERPPLVLVHGFLSGIGLWACNLDALAAHHVVYCIDWIGFGRSSRPRFAPTSAEHAEDFFVNSLEQWREAVGLERMMLLGHSMGGYLAAAYALKYPNRLDRLVMADPWGLPTRPEDSEGASMPLKWRLALSLLSSRWLNPMALMRWAGYFGYGPSLLERYRSDLTGKWSKVLVHVDFEHHKIERLPISDYIYHMNARHPVGEHCFHAMSLPVGWAGRPMAARLRKISADLPVLMLYGSHSWMDPTPAAELCDECPNFEMGMVSRAGHHIYIDNHTDFNRLVTDFTTRKVRVRDAGLSETAVEI